MVKEILKELADRDPDRWVDDFVQSGLLAKGDPNLLRVLLENLVGNAWKFTNRVSPARIEVGVECHEDECVYYVKDNGVGFDMQYANKLFGAFQRLHRADDYDGTGIGLATVQRIVRRHGGRYGRRGRWMVGRNSTLPYTRCMFMCLALVLVLSQVSCNATAQNSALSSVTPGKGTSSTPVPTTLAVHSETPISSTRADKTPTLEPFAQLSNPSVAATSISSATEVVNSSFPLAPTSAPIPTCPPAEGYAWAFAYGEDTFNRVDTTFFLDDGDILFIGTSDVFAEGKRSLWTARLHPNGSIVWQKAYPATIGDHAWDANRIMPGRIVIADERIAFAITEIDGSLVWQKSFNESVRAIDTPDGGFAVMADNWVIKFDDQGEQVWQFVLKNDYFYQPTTTGEFVLARSFLYDETTSIYRPIFTDIEALKVRADGQLAWHKTFGKTLGDDEALARMLVTQDGGILLAGTHMGTSQFADSDIWVMKLSAGGSLSWQTTLSGKLWDNVDQITQLPNGEYALIGTTYGDDQEIEILIVKFKSNGAVAWQKTIPEIGNTQTIIGLDDGGILFSLSDDTLLARLDRLGNLVWDKWYRPDTYLTSLKQSGTDLLLSGSTSGRALLILLHDTGAPSGAIEVVDSNLKVSSTMGSRPNQPLEYGKAQISVDDPGITSINIDVGLEPFCLTARGEHPRPTSTFTQTLTVTITPPPTTIPLAFARALYLTSPSMTGDDVYAVQLRLLDLGYTEIGVLDGIFGALTDQAVRHFQERNGLGVDGVVGTKTWGLLFNGEAIRAK